MDADLCVIGGGEAGFAAASAGAALGLKVIVVDPARTDPCWRNWDVALAALRHAAQAETLLVGGGRADALTRLRIDLRSALERAAPDRRFARLAAMNVRLVRGSSRFTDPDTITVAGARLRARRYLLATGSPADDAARRLLDALLGPGNLPAETTISPADPRGVALAQALARTGCRVRLAGRLLPGCDPELVAPIRRALLRDGLDLVETAADPVRGTVGDRRPLDVERAGIAVDEGRLVLSPALCTANRRVYAVGSCAGARSSAETQAQIAVALRSAFFRLPARFDPMGIPVTVVSDPGLATVGLAEPGTTASRMTVWRWPFAETAAGGAVEGRSGLLKVVLDPRGRVVGAGIVHPDAAELIPYWSLAVHTRQRLSGLAGVPLPAPAFAEASRRVATLAALRRLQSPWLKRALRILNRMP